MKRVLLALSLGLWMSACVGDAPVERTEDSAADPVAASCLSRCQTTYNTCLGNAQDATDVCLCHNQRVGCEIPCGVHGILEKCPVP